MLPPRRHRQRIEYCPECDRALGDLRPSSGGGKYLMIIHAQSVVWNDDVQSWSIICVCSFAVAWNGKEIKWRHPLVDAAA